jgi:tetratricopeptide (TPR) repeat protein
MPTSQLRYAQPANWSALSPNNDEWPRCCLTMRRLATRWASPCAGWDGYEAAVQAYREAIAQAPALADSYANLANVLQDLDRMEEAVVCYTYALDKGARQPSVHRGLGNALQRLQRLTAAEAAYRAALAVDPHYVPALMDLGGTLVELGHAAQLAPEDAQVHANLGMALDETATLRRHCRPSSVLCTWTQATPMHWLTKH